MTWIRNPSWDLCWILSAPLTGLAVVLFPPLMAAALTLRFAHAVSPMALAWSHRGYRPLMLARPGKFIGVPAGLLAAALVVAGLNVWWYPGFGPHWYPGFAPGRVEFESASWAKLHLPIIVLLNAYATWDIYHSGAQDFGLWCLFRRKSVSGWCRWAVLGAFVMLYVVLYHIVFWFFPLMILSVFLFGALKINHSLAAIGLCSHVHSRHWNVSPLWFAGGMLTFGLAVAAGYGWVQRISPPVDTFAVALYVWIGIWHFLQDRWIWRMSDPRVRATIGRDLFVRA